jgi:hypothetical protein
VALGRCTGDAAPISIETRASACCNAAATSDRDDIVSCKHRRIKIMAPSIPTCRPLFTPTRIAIVVAAIALVSNFTLILSDALAAGGVNALAPLTTACVDAPGARTTAEAGNHANVPQAQ